ANNFKPVFLISILATEAFNCSNDETEGYETYLEAKAREKNMPTLGIETVIAQMEALNTMNDSVNIAYLKAYFDNNPNNKEKLVMKQQTKDLLSFYKKQDLQGLYNIVKKNEVDANMNLNALLNDRN